MDFDADRMAMQPPAFMMLGEIRQPMRRFYGKDLEYFHNLLRARPSGPAFLRFLGTETTIPLG
jgi:hypothetical protein